MSQEIKLIIVDLLRFNYLKVIAGDNKSRLDVIQKLYSKLSANSKLNKDDLFWNAFGMCERQLGNYSEAIKHLRTGISYAKNRRSGYVPYHAQNQLIVCLLERGVNEDIDTLEAYNNAIEVADLLIVQAEDEVHYGSGQAFHWHESLSTFLNIFVGKYSDSQRVRVIMALMKYVKFIKTKVSGWKEREAAAFMVAKVETFLRAHPLGR
ncbi:tetratricopeptide (TPR) repeat protein [Pseudochrobactrum saccharolyticum]|uniref:Tetratricopeptide (TPR) repeat protein n=1 Tax=Pseudochrobactrum saccharolyticum TaxID=354352 RepID=A0A7W8ER61_9HYPH|nr:hypothetical protein [Pseudochrobactrum saccharolyticum]KAB0537337.1 hypothetical protein F7P81_15120 [Pseudochrobactrum saccharolyticum]MBB5092177.1 tetratricopeptide (TPR) repeat protein [Pseudochrobactrum saccharolyticum]